LIGEDECKQIILNLIMNGLEAIEGAGKIAIRTRNIAEGRVELVISDTGRGIPGDLLPRIFDPFFSTKTEQGNSGLGLSVVYGLVSKFQGSINVKSREGQGTEVCIQLPAATSPV
jgi:signal transduction histidine kinase